MARYSKEVAQEVLERYRGEAHFEGSYFEAIVSDELDQHYFGRLLYFRTAFFDDLPEVDVHDLIDIENERASQYKCQGNYLVGMSLELQGAVADGMLDGQEWADRVDTFIHSDLDFKIGDPKNVERIKSINLILDDALTYLGAKITA